MKYNFEMISHNNPSSVDLLPIGEEITIEQHVAAASESGLPKVDGDERSVQALGLILQENLY